MVIRRAVGTVSGAIRDRRSKRKRRFFVFLVYFFVVFVSAFANIVSSLAASVPAGRGRKMKTKRLRHRRGEEEYRRGMAGSPRGAEK